MIVFIFLYRMIKDMRRNFLNFNRIFFNDHHYYIKICLSDFTFGDEQVLKLKKCAGYFDEWITRWLTIALRLVSQKGNQRLTHARMKVFPGSNRNRFIAESDDNSKRKEKSTMKEKKIIWKLLIFRPITLTIRSNAV